MGSTYSPCKKEGQPNTNLRRFSTGLNDILQDHHYPLPSPEEIFNKLNIKNIQNLREPLNELLKKDKPWLWTPECQKSFKKIKKTPECQEPFEKIKKNFTSDLSLTHYDPTLDIIVASDASSYGIGACILHKLPEGSRKAVAHASRSLLPVEKQYSQIEKEVLGIIFAVTKFYRYPHGRRFILQTDHKPLITIFGPKKGLPVYTANRLLRWGTILLNYSFKKCRLNESEESPQNTCEVLIDAIFDHFDLDTPQISPEVRRSGRKRKFTQPLDVNPKRQKY